MALGTSRVEGCPLGGRYGPGLQTCFGGEELLGTGCSCLPVASRWCNTNQGRHGWALKVLLSSCPVVPSQFSKGNQLSHEWSWSQSSP